MAIYRVKVTMCDNLFRISVIENRSYYFYKEMREIKIRIPIYTASLQFIYESSVLSYVTAHIFIIVIARDCWGRLGNWKFELNRNGIKINGENCKLKIFIRSSEEEVSFHWVIIDHSKSERKRM